MQHNSDKADYLKLILGQTYRVLREKLNQKSLNKIEEEYDIGRGSLSRLENAKVDSKFTTLWKYAEALNVKLSDIIKDVEDKVDDNFQLTEE